MTQSSNQRIAIASSGLGHIARGIETWALDTACALAACGVDVTLFCAGPVAVAPEAASRLTVVVVPCLRRNDARARRLARTSPSWSWRWGLRSAYGWEQWSFWRRIRGKLKRGRFNVLHVQDPMVAYWCRRCRERGRIATREILAHGTEESLDFLAPFERVQHLAPWHLEQTAAALRSRDRKWVRPLWAAIPNFVDTETFKPAADTERRAWREAHDIPEDALLLGCAAAVKRDHKRIDYLIDEFAAYSRGGSRCFAATGAPRPRPVYLVIAGSHQRDTAELIARARREAHEHIRIMVDLPRADMPAFYGALDLFVLTSLFEMMPIAVLEALSSGVPLLVNDHPVLAWMVGEGGVCLNMSEPGALADYLNALSGDWLKRSGQAARKRAVEAYSHTAVIAKYQAYYADVMADAVPGAGESL